MRRIQGIALLCGAALLLSACGGDDDEPVTAATTTEAQTAQPSGEPSESSSGSPSTSATAESTSPEPTDGDSASSGASVSPSASDGPSADSDPSSPDAPILGEDRAGQTLTLSDFFSPDEDWDENRYDVADQSEVTGIAGQIVNCGADRGSGPEELEMRLANNFEGLSFSAGQANDSDSSEQVLIVRVEGNGDQLEVKRIPFNETATFELDVQDVNSLIIQTYLDDQVEGCSSNGSAQAVFWDFELQ